MVNICPIAVLASKPLHICFIYVSTCANTSTQLGGSLNLLAISYLANGVDALLSKLTSPTKAQVKKANASSIECVTHLSVGCGGYDSTLMDCYACLMHCNYAH